MFRAWGKIIRQNRLVKDIVIEIEDYSISRTQKVYKALEDMCYAFDLGKPIWLELNKKDFIKNARTRFTKDCFIEEIDFEAVAKKAVQSIFKELDIKTNFPKGE